MAVRQSSSLGEQPSGGLIVESSSPSVFDFVLEHGHEIVDGDAALVHGIPVADGYLVVFQGVKIHGHAVGCADLVLAAITPTDALGIVELSGEVAPTFR